MFRGGNTTEDKSRKPIFLKLFLEASIEVKCGGEFLQLISLSQAKPASKQSTRWVRKAVLTRADFSGLSGIFTGPFGLGAPFQLLSQPCLLKSAINYFPLMVKEKKARRKDTKAMDWEEWAWCENQVAYVWCLHPVSGDLGGYGHQYLTSGYQVKVSFRAEMALAACLAAKELK